MGRARRARKIAMAAAYGGGGLGLVGAGAAGILVGEAKLARRAIGKPQGTPPTCDGVYGAPELAQVAPIGLALLGDSSAAGLGVHEAHETPGALLAAGLAEASGRPVRLRCVARVGAKSQDLQRQIDLVLRDASPPPDIAVVMVGANDVTHQVNVARAVRALDEAVRRLRAAGAEVVVGTCPDLGTIEPVAQPLRWIARRWSRQLAAAQTIAVVEAGGRTVSLGDLLGPEFASNPSAYFSADRFHPSAAGYASVATAVLPSVCAILEEWPTAAGEGRPDARRGEGVRPVARAAVLAANSAGTEVAAAEVGGHERGRRGRWALLRHRLRGAVPAVEELAPEDCEPAASPDAAVRT